MFLRYNFYTIIWGILILVVTLSPSSGNFSDIYGIYYDKVIHCLLFIGFTLLMIIGFHKQQTFTWLRFNAIKGALIVANIFGLLVELGQFFVPLRTVEWQDMLANSSGTIIGLLMFLIIYKL